ncbi:dTDP-4-dehydrorhamnose reductase [Oxobacter pfennigii]|uniref:dTDP-4-dehydrorhamnose reductase n=1 Tax=Oxobacter pfennigii TaxID=36849 RepID=A0A0P8WZ22_9CLOT|nr:dTDP-4-dehydrorhamnose reductase [Oxobacter pfennigii]KPU43698.1 dTDP-4-dehydrorhamnose reductase [Oxobacter pfennigii]
MKVLVTGAKGQLGIDLANILKENYDVIGLSSQDLDITNINTVVNTVKRQKPDIIINCAAYAKVDDCEKNIDLAYKVNAIGTKNLAAAAIGTNSRLLHISTDFVFDGEKHEPYIEFDTPNPLSIYGKSKLAGENLIKEICQKHYILRTAWLYGKNGQNFVKTMLKLAESRDTLTVVDDQIGCPTYTMDLVKVIDMLIKTDAYGTYHVTNEGQCSWNDFAKKIFEMAGKTMNVLPISSVEYNSPAKRPKYSVLKNYMLELQFGYKTRPWEKALQDFFE